VPLDDSIQIHLVEFDSSVLHGSARDQLEAVDERSRRCSSVGLDDGHDDIATLVAHAPTFLEHREGLSDARGCAEEHPEATAFHAFILSRPGRCCCDVSC
jgi:hypothetical protein